MSEQVFSFDTEQWEKLKQSAKENAGSRGISFCTDFTFCQNQTEYTQATQLQDASATYSRVDQHTDTATPYNRNTPLRASTVKARYSRDYTRTTYSRYSGGYGRANYSADSRGYRANYSQSGVYSRSYTEYSRYSRYSRYSDYSQVSVCNDTITYTRVVGYQEGVALNTNLPSVPVLLGTEDGHIPVFGQRVKIALFSYDKDVDTSSDATLKTTYYDVYIQQIKDKYGIRVTGKPLTKIKSNVAEDSIGGGLTFDFDTTPYVDGYYRIIAVARNAPKAMTFPVTGDAAKTSETVTYYMQDIETDSISKVGEYDGVSLVSGLAFGRGETNDPNLNANTKDVTSGLIYDMYSVSEVRIRQNHPAFFEAGIKNATQTFNMIFAGLDTEDIKPDETRGGYNTTSKVLKTYGSDEIAGGDSYISLRNWTKGVVASIELTESNTDQWVEVVGELVNKATGEVMPNSRVVAQFPTDVTNPNAYVHTVKSGGIGVKLQGYLYWPATLFKESVDSIRMEEYYVQTTVSEYTSEDKATLVQKRTYSSESVNDNGDESGESFGFKIDLHEPIVDASTNVPDGAEWTTELNVDLNISDNQDMSQVLIQRWDCGVTKDTVYAELYGNGHLAITGTGEMMDYASSNSVPWMLYANKVKSLSIEDGIVNIGNNAFRSMKNLMSMQVSGQPSKLKKIGEYAFQGCSSLINVTVPQSVTYIGSKAFAGCSGNMTSVKFDENYQQSLSIGQQAFYQVPGISYLATNTVYSAAAREYEGTDWAWTPYLDINIGKTTEVIAHVDFNTGEMVISGEGETIDISEDSDFWGEVESKVKTVSISSGVTSIGENLFANCSIESIQIPDSVTSIGKGAFAGCTELSAIQIPSGVTVIKEKTFAGCTGVSVVAIHDKVTEIQASAFEGCTELSSVIIPKSVVKIGAKAFAGCTKISNTIELSENMTSIDYSAFEGLLGEKIIYSIQNAACKAAAKEAGSVYGQDYQWSSNAVQIGDDAYMEYKDGVLTISGTGALYSYSSADGYAWNEYRDNITQVVVQDGITNIPQHAFEDCFVLKSITIPNSIKSIGDNAFLCCYSLKSITIPNGVTSIGNKAFYFCYALQSITIPNTVTLIGDNAFYTCTSLRSITLPDNLTSIGNSAFEGCVALASVTIPNSVTSIGNKAFYNNALRSVSIPSSVTSIGNAAFAYCKALKSVTISGAVTSIKDDTFNRCYALQSITLPNSITSIGNNAFNNCNALQTIVIPNRVTSIGDNAFYNDGLQSIVIPSSVTSIGSGAFTYCKSLKSVTISGAITSIKNDTFGYCYALRSIALPNSVTSIGSKAFYRCFALQSVTIPSSVTSLGDDAFSSCKALQFVSAPASLSISPNVVPATASQMQVGSNAYATLKNGVLTISGTGALYEYSSSSQYAWNQYRASITEVVIQNGITNIPNNAFRQCYALHSVTIPNSVTAIGSYAFCSCYSLQSITIPDSVKSIGSYAFTDCYSLQSVTIPNSVTSIGSYVFSACYALQSVVISNSITSIGAYAFNWCCSLQSITIPDSVTSIGNYAFYYCKELQSIAIPNKVNSIGNYAFYGCQSLKSITIPNSVMSIGNNAFDICYALQSVTMPNSITSIGTETFRWCSSLKSITIPKGVTSIGDSAFEACHSLQEMSIPNGVTSIGVGAYKTCYSLQSMTIPNGITTIKNDVFYNCYALQSITIPDSITSIGDTAFYNCKSLQSMKIPNNVLSIGSNAFANSCRAVLSIVIPEKIENISFDAFQGVKGKQVYYYPSNDVCIAASKEAKEKYGDAYEWTQLSDNMPDEKIDVDIPDDNDDNTEDTSWDCGILPNTVTASLEDGVLTFSGHGLMKNYDINKAPWYKKKDEITSVKILDGVTSVGANAFNGYSALKEVSLSNAVIIIGQSAFDGCSKLQEIQGYQSVVYIGANAFKRTSLTKFIMPASVSYIGKNAFNGVSGVSYYSDSKIAKKASADYESTTPWNEIITEASSKLKEVFVVYRDINNKTLKTDEYSVKNGKLNEDSETFSTKAMLDLANGEYAAGVSVDVIARDNVGNTKTYQAISGVNVDNSTASITVDKEPKADGGWFTTSISPVVTVKKEKGKEIEKIKILESTSAKAPALNDSSWVSVDNPGRQFVYSTDKIGKKTGTQYIHVYVNDGLHEPEIKTFGPYNFDLESPEVNVSCNAIRKWQHETTVTAAITDSSVGSKLQGVSMKWYYSDGKLGGVFTKNYTNEYADTVSMDINIPDNTSDNGIYVEIVATDNAGNETKTKVQNIYLDRTAPIVSVTPPATDYPNWVKETIDTVLNVSKEKGAAIKDVKIAEVKGIANIADVPDDAWESLAVGNGHSIEHPNNKIGQDSGEHYLYVKINNGIDAEPLEYSFGPYKVDLINPEVASVDLNMNHANAARWVEQYNRERWYWEPVEYRVYTKDDGGSKIAVRKYQITNNSSLIAADDSNWIAVPWSKESDNAMFVEVTKPGSNYIHTYLKDNAGNENNENNRNSTEIKIDLDNPVLDMKKTIHGRLTGNTLYGYINYVLKVSDATSGVKVVKYAVTDSPTPPALTVTGNVDTRNFGRTNGWVDITDGATSEDGYEFNLKASGRSYVHIYAEDNAGRGLHTVPANVLSQTKIDTAHTENPNVEIRPSYLVGLTVVDESGKLIAAQKRKDTDIGYENIYALKNVSSTAVLRVDYHNYDTESSKIEIEIIDKSTGTVVKTITDMAKLGMGYTPDGSAQPYTTSAFWMDKHGELLKSGLYELKAKLYKEGRVTSTVSSYIVLKQNTLANPTINGTISGKKVNVNITFIEDKFLQDLADKYRSDSFVAGFINTLKSEHPTVYKSAAMLTGKTTDTITHEPAFENGSWTYQTEIKKQTTFVASITDVFGNQAQTTKTIQFDKTLYDPDDGDNGHNDSDTDDTSGAKGRPVHNIETPSADNYFIGFKDSENDALKGNVFSFLNDNTSDEE